MPRPKSLIPTYRLHKSTGQAVAYVGRREHYLGAYGSPESRDAYAALLDKLRRGQPVATGKPAKRCAPTCTLNDLFLRYATERMPNYTKPEQECLQTVIREARTLFGETAVADFGPLRLQTIREAMVGRGWSRSYINHQVKRLRRIFRWGVSKELVQIDVVTALATVESLRYGEAPGESRERRALSEEQIQAVRAELIERWRDPFDLLLLTGCRPGELLGLTTAQIDRSGEIWRVDLAKHKNAHRGKSRVIFFNAAAQLILRKYLAADPDAKLFDMRLDSFSKAVRAACEVAFGMPGELRHVHHTVARMKNATKAQRAKAKAELSAAAAEWRRKHAWTPHWLRHTVATRLADEVGTEAAQRLLGHATRAMTEHYSKAAERQAIDAVKRLG